MLNHVLAPFLIHVFPQNVNHVSGKNMIHVFAQNVNHVSAGNLQAARPLEVDQVICSFSVD